MDSSAGDLDERVRLAAFHFLGQRTDLTPDGVLSRTILAAGFTFDGSHVLLLGPQRRCSRWEAGAIKVRGGR